MPTISLIMHHCLKLREEVNINKKQLTDLLRVSTHILERGIPDYGFSITHMYSLNSANASLLVKLPQVRNPFLRKRLIFCIKWVISIYENLLGMLLSSETKY